MNSILLITPPLTQLNTPYPATAVLKGFLQEQGKVVHQADLGIELINALFTAKELEQVFAEIETKNVAGIHKKVLSMKTFYLETIEPVMAFLQGKNQHLAIKIVGRRYLPEGPRFKNLVDLEWVFGTMGTIDQAKYLATLYIEDLADLIRNYLDEGFELVRYKQHLSESAHHFAPIHKALLAEEINRIDAMLLEVFATYLDKYHPAVVGFTVPFPGNLYGALKCAQFLKKHQPEVKIIMGGGYVNTELRDIQEPRFFEFIDYLIFDDGEQPFLQLLNYFDGKTSEDALIRTTCLRNKQLIHFNNTDIPPLPFVKTGTPDFTGLTFDKYLSLIETVNPMHKLWTDGYWNKVTLAHGCYWAHCAFCDTTLDYIKRYESGTAEAIVEKLKAIMKQTGSTGFHFTDEAAPPGLLKSMAIEIIRHKLQITWWGNIRFEKAFTADLCQLLAASGCIAVTGGIETASDRLLRLMNKGVSLEKAAQVTRNFTKAGIMVHAYLMFGFPGETVQETIDSLEIVKQFFEAGLFQSAYWHRFALTIHSPVAQLPERYGITILDTEKHPFANNEIAFFDPVQEQHPDFGPGLAKATYNFMHGMGFDQPVHRWFDFKIKPANIPPRFVKNFLKSQFPIQPANRQLVWIGGQVSLNENGKQSRLFINNPAQSATIETDKETVAWIVNFLTKCSLNDVKMESFNDWSEAFHQTFQIDLEAEPWFNQLRKSGLLVL
ncbi:MAG: radical SAM protein [Bacteroidetes bacterium HGW-Bacteroidetes-4]|jgi:hypothetical protein|nr:MAG: radical SAM protein [Bacteroidetes bacterium HGW-Bacteroidetes-4]